MERTRLGVSIGMVGAFAYAAALFGGYLASAIVLGYILLFENNQWLRRTAVKATATLACFSMLTLLIGLFPDAFNWILSVVNVFGAGAYVPVVSNLFAVFTTLVSILKDIVFAILIVKALKLQTINIPVVDNLINAHM
ncbi:hypothetical protein [Butyrivibrio sp. MC2013]|uniref:hypothetical protein n=1 Tax=Butyrivibrio sp. MC2013 TaxID=1280686 RepID=UPI000404DEB3|nr:hypothetical protein [Butyrivibrio sp. MC2013]